MPTDRPAGVSPAVDHLGVLALDHTAIAVHDIEAALPLYRDLLGGVPSGFERLVDKGFMWLTLAYPNGSQVELLQPLGQSGFLHAFLGRYGEGVHHLTFVVRDLKTAVDRARSAGLRIVDEDYRDSHWQEAFISPRSAHGTIVQLAQTDLTAADKRHHWSVTSFGDALPASGGLAGADQCAQDNGQAGAQDQGDEEQQQRHESLQIVREVAIAEQEHVSPVVLRAAHSSQHTPWQSCPGLDSVEARNGFRYVGWHRTPANASAASPSRRMAVPEHDAATQAETRLLRALYSLPAAEHDAPDPAELVEIVAVRACELLRGDCVALYLWDDQSARLVPAFTNDPRQNSTEEPLRLGEGAAGQALERREAIIVDDYQNWEHARPWGLGRGLRAVDAVPLIVGDRPIGVLIVRFYAPRPTSLEDDRWMLTVLAAQVALALEAARLYATSNWQRQQEQVLREITQALAAHLDERTVLDLAVKYATTLTSAPYGRVWLIDDNGELTCAAAAGYVHSGTFERRLAPDSTSGVVAREKLVNLANATVEPGWYVNREFGAHTGLGSYLGAGLWRAGTSLGVLEVMRQPDRRFTALEEQILVTLADAVAVAVSNARLHAAAERLAREAAQRADSAAESELMLRSVYEAIGSGVLVYDAHGRIVNANAVAAGILGRTRDELAGMHQRDLSDVVDADGRPLTLSELPIYRAVAARASLRKVTIGVPRPDGRRRWLLMDAVPIFAADGTLLRIISSFVDITDQRRSESALQQRDAVLEAVAFAAEQLLRATDWEPGIDAVLAHLGRAMGASRVYIVPGYDDDADQRLAHEWNRPGVERRPQLRPHGSSLTAVGLGRWEAILRAGGTIQGPLSQFPNDEREFLSAQGVRSLVVVPIFAGDRWWGLIGFDDCAAGRAWTPDVVEVLKTAAGTLGAAILRRQAEAERLQLVREQSARAEAEAAQRRLAFLAEASSILATSLDYEMTLREVAELVVPGQAECCFIDVREAQGAIRRVAATRAARFARSVGDLMGAQTDPQSDHPIAQVMRSGQPYLAATIDARFTQRAARHFASALIVPLSTRAGTVGAMTWLTSAERTPFDKQELDLAVDLGRRCALAIENARLYGEARAAVSLRDEFMSVAAHELKTPMTSLRGYAQLLAREFEKGEPENPERVQRAAATIQVQSDKLARLIGQLLDISRIQSGKLALDPRETDLSALVRDILENTRTGIRGHTLEEHLPPELYVVVDPLRIEQVLTNLVDNAIKYSPDGGQIIVDLSHDRHTVRLSVRDFGVGVPTEHRAQIFDRFYQAHAGGPLTSMAGMGLGLYISRQIVDLHGGDISAEFPEEGGTRFVVRLPASTSHGRPTLGLF